MKILGTSIFLFFATTLVGQKHSVQKSIVSKDSMTSFLLSFSTFNHADRIFNGTTTYLLTASSIKVTKTFFNKSKTVYFDTIPKTQTLISAITKIGLDSLKDVYTNYCVMITSGDEYFLDFTSSTVNKSISLHHYYLKQLDEIIQIINSHLPKEYQICYLTKDTKQDCNLL